MNKATTRDKLRNDYLKLLPELTKIQRRMETKIRWYLKDIQDSLNKKYQRIEIESRIKECESAIDTLERKQNQIHRFDENKLYTLTELPDLVGLRILVFPPSLILPVNKLIISKFKKWKSDHKKIEKKGGKKTEKITICKKYRGVINKGYGVRPDNKIKVY